MLIFVAGLVLAFGAYVLGRMSSSPSAPLPEPKRFGLKEAEAALIYVGNAGPAATKAVLGVVVGVLGFENAVVADAESEVAEHEEENRNRAAMIEKAKAKIVELEEVISDFRADTADADVRSDQLRDIAKAFSA